MTDSLTQRLHELRAERNLSTTDLTTVEALSREDIDLLFTLAREFRKAKTAKLDLLKGRSVALAFFESSTRTQSSFDWAAKQLGADTVGVGSGTAEKKHESFLDVAQVIDAMNAAAVVIRTEYSGLPQQISKHTSAAIINAGDGWHEHPTQGLLEALTAMDELGSLEGKVVTFVGDVLHSRVFGSSARLLRTLGARVRVAAPLTFLPEQVEEVFGVEVFTDVEAALPGSDIVNVIRVQNERGATGDIPTIREYSKAFGISRQRLALAKPGAILMHAGPVQRDTDIHHALMTVPESRILQMVENGLALRKALLWLLCTGPTKSYTRI